MVESRPVVGEGDFLASRIRFGEALEREFYILGRQRPVASTEYAARAELEVDFRVADLLYFFSRVEPPFGRSRLEADQALHASKQDVGLDWAGAISWIEVP